jgi:hypothetical protein
MTEVRPKGMLRRLRTSSAQVWPVAAAMISPRSSVLLLEYWYEDPGVNCSGAAKA